MKAISKSDWKLYRSKIADWQERYMDQLNHEYIELLGSDEPASTKFWELEKRINQDKKKPGVLVQMQKSSAYWDIATMVNDGTITFEDLDEFSDDLKDAVKLILGR